VALDPIHDRTALRKQLLANGYAPLPNVDKICVIKDWPRLTIDEAFIDRYRRADAYQATGLRIQDGLVAIDGDVPIDGLAQQSLQLVRPGLLRIGKPPKWMRLVRCPDIEHPVLRSHKWTNGSDIARIEIFLGGSRQIGAFGWHTRGERLYRWPGKSPLDVPLARLPLIRQRHLAAICDRFNELAGEHGLVRVEQPKPAPGGARLFDLDESSRFDDSDGRMAITIDQLTANYLAARHSGRDYRVSSSFTGDRGHNTSKCWVFWHPGADCIAIYDHEQAITHLPRAAAGLGQDVPLGLRVLFDAHEEGAK
jgi:hypothetical protein